MKVLKSLLAVKARLFNLQPQKDEQNDRNIQGSSSLLFKQFLTALGPFILTVSSGMVFGYSAILLPQLQSNNTNASIRINQEQASWVASLAVLPMAAGTLIGGFCIQKYGRKMTHIIVCLPAFLGWLLIYFASNLEILLSGRFITGLCAGIVTPASGVYIGETTEPKNRGILLGGIPLCVSLGLLLSHLLGTFLSWQTTALIISILPILSWILMLFTPESPAWYAQKGHSGKAEEAFYWLRGTSDAAKEELNIMLAKQKNLDENSEDRSVWKCVKELLQPEFVKPMVILIVFFITSQWAGVSAVNFYSVTLMKQTLGDSFNEYLATIIMDLIRLIASIAACVLLKRISKRILALIGGLGTFIPLFILSGYLYFTKIYDLKNTPALLAVGLTSMIAYVFFVTAGFVTLPWNLLGELLPLAKRSTGSAIASFIAYMAVFSVVKTTPEMFQNLKPEGAFLVYGGMSFLGTVFVYTCLPETRGKTLNDIEEFFKNKKQDKCKEPKETM